ncbi:MAG: hypothetical protein BWK73_10420 [Thiothrix lacustris]|uniref:Toprim domain-containing protein n=1 Tax=Thiothrix lacustris TaxID=525917 RepID=A0A1Y1QUN6_9GAMM|nr:MAG: hypothetical protein BWK73_10420 [Thiothrix lacustris]
MANEKKDYAQIMAENVIAALEKGTAPWQRPWEAGEAPNTPMNPSTGNAYKGWNRVWLSTAQPDNDPRWLTYKQAEKMGAQVREGEKATPIFIWKTHGTKLLTDDKNKPILDAEGKKQYKIVPYERPYRNTAFVFHASQIDGLPALEKKEAIPEWQRHSEAERILAASQAPIFHDQANRAYYTPTRDQIHLPQREQFPTPDAYYATALHEFGHSTGHSSRLDRDLDHPFGSAGYAIEELRAEMFSLMLGQEIGIGHDPEQHHAYIGSWIKALKEDPEELFRAARDAQSMMDYTHERVKEYEQEQANAQANEPPTPHFTHDRLEEPPELGHLSGRYTIIDSSNTVALYVATEQEAITLTQWLNTTVDALLTDPAKALNDFPLPQGIEPTDQLQSEIVEAIQAQIQLVNAGSQGMENEQAPFEYIDSEGKHYSTRILEALNKNHGWEYPGDNATSKDTRHIAFDAERQRYLTVTSSNGNAIKEIMNIDVREGHGSNPKQPNIHEVGIDKFAEYIARESLKQEAALQASWIDKKITQNEADGEALLPFQKNMLRHYIAKEKLAEHGIEFAGVDVVGTASLTTLKDDLKKDFPYFGKVDTRTLPLTRDYDILEAIPAVSAYLAKKALNVDGQALPFAVSKPLTTNPEPPEITAEVKPLPEKHTYVAAMEQLRQGNVAEAWATAQEDTGLLPEVTQRQWVKAAYENFTTTDIDPEATAAYIQSNPAPDVLKALDQDHFVQALHRLGWENDETGIVLACAARFGTDEQFQAMQGMAERYYVDGARNELITRYQMEDALKPALLEAGIDMNAAINAISPAVQAAVDRANTQIAEKILDQESNPRERIDLPASGQVFQWDSNENRYLNTKDQQDMVGSALYKGKILTAGTLDMHHIPFVVPNATSQAQTTPILTLDDERDIRGQALAAETQAIQTASVSAIGDATAAWATYQQLQSTAEAQGLTTQLLPSNDNDGMYTLHYLDGERVTAVETEIRLPDGAALTTYDGEPITTDGFTTDPGTRQQALNAALAQNQERNPSIEVNSEAHFEKSHPLLSEVQPLSEQALSAEIAKASQNAVEGYNAQESLENLEAVAARNGMTVSLSQSPDEHLDIIIHYLKDGKETGITTDLLSGDGKAVTAFHGERIPGTGFTSDLEWQSEALQRGIEAFHAAEIRQEVNQLIADNEAYSPELAEKDGSWQLIVGIETLATYTNEDEATQALSYVNNVGAAIALQMLHPERIPEGMDAVAIIADTRTPSLAEQEAANRQGNLYYETASRLEAARDNSSDKAIIAEVIQRLETAGFTNDGQASYVKDGIAVTTDNGATRQEPSVILLSQQNPNGSWQVNVGRSSEFGDFAPQAFSAAQVWAQVAAEIQHLEDLKTKEFGESLENMGYNLDELERDNPSTTFNGMADIDSAPLHAKDKDREKPAAAKPNIDAALEDAEKQPSPSVVTPSTTEQAAIQSRADDLAATKPPSASQEADDLQRKAEALKDKQSSEATQPKDNHATQENPAPKPKQENASSFVVSNQPAIAQEKTFLAIPFADKDKAKKAAGQLPQGGPAIGWDSNTKSWYANVGADLNKLKQWLPENVKDRQERPDPPEVEFAKALKDAGLELPASPIMDGAKHRVSAVGDKTGQKSGEYVGYKDGHPAGFIRNFRDESKTGSWKYTGNKVDQESVQDWRAINAEREAQKTAQLQAKHQLTANTVATAWENLRPTPNPEHPYLVAKGLQGDLDQLRKLGIKQDDKGNLVVPARDKDGKIWNMQRIGGTGWKGFEKDAKLQGCFHVIGGRKALREQGNNEPVIVSTGFGTAATIHLATGKPVVVAFNDNNLKSVAEEFKKIFPERSQAIFGDDDKHLPLLPMPLANSGREKATTAAESVGGIAVFPRFAAGTEPTKEFSDFNDLAKQQGMRAVQRQVEQGLAQARSTVTIKKALEKAQAKDKPEKNRAGGMEIAR